MGRKTVWLLGFLILALFLGGCGKAKERQGVTYEVYIVDESRETHIFSDNTLKFFSDIEKKISSDNTKKTDSDNTTKENSDNMTDSQNGMRTVAAPSSTSDAKAPVAWMILVFMFFGVVIAFFNSLFKGETY